MVILGNETATFVPLKTTTEMVQNLTQVALNTTVVRSTNLNITSASPTTTLNTTIAMVLNVTQRMTLNATRMLHSSSTNTNNSSNVTTYPQTTLNATASPKQSAPTAARTFHWVDVMLITSFVLIFLVGVVGNSLVCYFFRVTSTKLRGMARLIYYLAIVDLLASIVNPMLYLYWQVTFNRKWHFGYLGCKVLPILAKCSITISLGIILLITIDRCIVISRPFHPRLKDKHMRVALVVIIVYSVLCETPMMVFSEIHPKYTCLVPDLRVDGFFYPTIVIYLSRDIIFLATFVTTVMIIYLELYNKASVKTLKEQKDLNKNKAVMRMLIVLAVVFIILVFPREILHIVYMMSWKFGNGIPHSDTIRNINAFLKVLHMCNSVCNVFIYAGLHGRFRYRLLRFLYKLVGRQYTANSFATNMSESAYDTRYVEGNGSYAKQSSSEDQANSRLILDDTTVYNANYFKYQDTTLTASTSPNRLSVEGMSLIPGTIEYTQT